MKLLHVDFMSSFPYHILLKSDKKIIQFLLPYIQVNFILHFAAVCFLKIHYVSKRAHFLRICIII